MRDPGVMLGGESSVKFRVEERRSVGVDASSKDVFSKLLQNALYLLRRSSFALFSVLSESAYLLGNALWV